MKFLIGIIAAMELSIGEKKWFKLEVVIPVQSVLRKMLNSLDHSCEENEPRDYKSWCSSKGKKENARPLELKKLGIWGSMQTAWEF